MGELGTYSFSFFFVKRNLVLVLIRIMFSPPMVIYFLLTTECLSCSPFECLPDGNQSTAAFHLRLSASAWDLPPGVLAV